MLAQALAFGMMIIFFVSKPSPQPSPSPFDIWMNDIQPNLLFIVQVASLIFLIIYVMKTADMAKSSNEAAKATQQSATATEDAVGLSNLTLKEMQEARHAATAPNVVVYVSLRGGIVDLIMENLGQTIAQDIDLTFDPGLKVEVVPHRPLPAFVTDKTPSLAPRQKLSWVLNSYAVILNNSLPTRYKVTVSYHGGDLDKHYQQEFILDIKSFHGTTLLSDKLIDTLEKGLGEITDAVKKTPEALDNMKDSLDFGLASTAAMINQVTGWQSGDTVVYFKNLVRSLASDWNAWQGPKEPDNYLPSKLLEQRFYLSVHAVVAITPHLPVSDDTLSQIRRLMFNLEAAGADIKLGWGGVEERVGETLKELAAIADSLGAEPF